MGLKEESSLIDAVQETIARYARRLTRDHATAEDLSQVGLLRVVRWARLRSSSPSNTVAWAVRTAINAMLSALMRGVRRIQESEVPCELDVMAECFAAPDDPRAAVAAVELARAIRRRLGARARELFDAMVETGHGPRNGSGVAHFKAAACPFSEVRQGVGLAKTTAWRARNEIQNAAREVLAG